MCLVERFSRDTGPLTVGAGLPRELIIEARDARSLPHRDARSLPHRVARSLPHRDARSLPPRDAWDAPAVGADLSRELFRDPSAAPTTAPVVTDAR